MWRRAATCTTWTAALLAPLLSIGCGGDLKPVPRTEVDRQFFGPAGMKLSPVFTKVADFDADNKPDGIEAVVELQDSFGDPTKSAGRILFTLYDFRPYVPDNRGARLAGPYEGRIDSINDQKARWSRVNRAYIFQLGLSSARADHDYVLEAMFEAADGRRLFDRLFIEGEHEKPTTGPAPLSPSSTTAPSDRGPATRPASAGRSAAAANGTLSSSVTSQPHEPPARADQP